ncbi:MAG TPA: TonB-dependent receptor [Gammaproteobacteria bacterium]|nr:TonB-dependent receptor [Gammaproteobacteria bacterium]
MLTLSAPIPAIAQNDNLDALRAEITALRSEYDARIQALEERLAAAERQPAPRAVSAAAPAPMRAAGNTAFNPAIGVIFEGQAWNFDRDAEGYGIPGFPFGGEAGPKDEGLGLGETEINISANVDDKFTAWLTAPIAIEDGEAGIEIEEAWLETTRLPAGLSVRFGRFFSGIGYLNDKHAHAWDFADQPLAYQALLGDQFIDDGVQLRWIAPTSLYLEVGAELTRGARFPIDGAARSGRSAKSLFVNVGGDVGNSHSWLAGISHLTGTSSDRPSGSEDDPLFFSGDSDTTIAEFVWKWAPNGNWRQRNFVFQTEYFMNSEAGEYSGAGLFPLAYDNDREGWYAQAVYQPVPRWRFGVRLDSLSLDDPGALFAGTVLEQGNEDPSRYSLMADWSNSEFSRIRLQFSREDTGPMTFSQWGLQYLHSIGAHGAHTF